MFFPLGPTKLGTLDLHFKSKAMEQYIGIYILIYVYWYISTNYYVGQFGVDLPICREQYHPAREATHFTSKNCESISVTGFRN